MTPSHIGKYEIQRRLGAGGMGSLYLARDPGLDRLVALKLLKDELQDEPELRERFTREARSVARLSHRNIIVVYEIGEDQGRPFMAMEYIAGETLNQYLRRAPTPPIAKRLSLIEDLCDGLAHAHAAGIIHRDIKPANIMLDGEGVLKILDFGIARIGKAGITQDGVMMGTVNYMSPEQAMGSTVDHRSDIFATGAVLYEVIALAQAFPGWIDSGVLHRILYAGPVPLTERAPGIDPELAGIVQRALEHDPNQRYQDLTTMRRDIARVRRRLQEAGHDPGATSTGRQSSDDRQSDRRVLDPKRVAKFRRQEVEDNLRLGEEAFARGDHDAALQYAERAAFADPDSPRAFDLLDKAKFAIEAKAIRQLLTEAHRLLSEGHLEDAAALVEEASTTLPDSQGVPELREEVRRTAEKIAAARERERRIDSSLERARASLDQGGFETALRAVYEVLALDPERPEARELEHLAKSRLHAQREHERARRSAYDQLKAARGLAGAGKFDEATDAINAVTPPSDTVRMEAAAALGDVRRLQREAARAAIVFQAQRALDDGQLEQALIVLDSIPSEDQSLAARSLRAAVEEALRQKREIERKRKALETAIDTIHGLIQSRDLTRALERVEDAARIGLDDARIPALRQQVSELITAAQEKKKEEARDRLATNRVEAARQLLAKGDGYAAIALLERDTSAHPMVAAALVEMRAAVAEQEERVRQDAERKRKESEARQRAELEARKRVEEQRKAEERQRQEEERRKREADQQRRQQEVATLLISVERALAENRPDEATVLLKQADAVGSVEDTELLHRVAAARAEAEARERRQRQLDAHLSRARELISRSDWKGARQAADAALALEPEHHAGRQLLHDIADAEKRQAEEAKRVAEARQREEEAKRQATEARKREEEARKREQALNELLARASQARTHEAALTILNEASALAPSDPRVLSQIAERNAVLERDRFEEQRRQQDARRIEEQQREEARRRAEEARRLEEQRHKEALAREQEARRRQDEEARRREEEARKREAAIVDLIGKADQIEEHDAALTLLRQAETIAPGDSRLRTLISERSAAMEAHRAELRAAEEAAKRERERREQEQRDATAATVVQHARQLFVQGRHDEALSLLRESPSHALIRTVIGELQGQLHEIEHQRHLEERRRVREERRAATRAAIDKAVHDRRVQTVAAVLVVATVALSAWWIWPTSPQQMSGPAGSVSGGTVPPIEVPPATGGTPPATSGVPPATTRNVPPTSVPSPAAPPAAPPVTPSPSAGPAGPSGRQTTAGGETRPGIQPPIATPPARSGSSPSGRTPTSTQPSTNPSPAILDGETPAPQVEPRVPVETPRQAPAPPPPTPTPQAPVPNPAPAGPRPATPNLAAEREAINQLLNEFVETYSSMDESRLRRIDPTFTGIRSRELIRSVRLALPERSINVSPDGQSATLTASGTYTYVWNRAGFPPTTRAQLNWRLQKVGGVWTVVR